MKIAILDDWQDVAGMANAQRDLISRTSRPAK
jgi:hypothetical protein